MSAVESWPVVAGVVAVYLAIMLGIGIARGRTQGQSVASFVAADRSLGAADMAGLLCGTMLSAFTFLGAPGLAYSRGGAILYAVVYGMLGVLPLYYFGPRLSEIGRRFGCVTQAQLISARFDSVPLRMLLALVGVGIAVPFLALQMQGAGLVVEWLTGGRVVSSVGVGVSFAVVVLYVCIGGAAAVARTSVWQAVLMFAVAVGLGLYLPWALHGGIDSMLTQLTLTRPDLLAPPGLGPDGNPWSWRDFASAIASSALAFALWPHLFMRVFAAKDAQSIRRAVAVFPLYQLILLPVILVGLAGIGVAVVSRPDVVLLDLVAKSPLSGVAIGLVCAAGLAAAMSTGDAVLHFAASSTVEDLVGPVTHLNEPARRRLMQLAVLAFAAMAFTLAITDVVPIVMLVIFAYGLVMQLAPPVYATLLWGRATTTGVLAGVLGGLFVTMSLQLKPEWRPFGLDAGLTGLGVNLVLLIATSLLTTRQSAEQVDAFLMRRPAP